MLHNRKLSAVAATLALTLALVSPMAAASGVVNVNTADVETLALLPRIGPTVAQRIIDFRDENGRFQEKEDLLLVKGIGEKTFELIAPYVVLEGESTLEEKVRLARSTEPTEEPGS